MVGVLECDGVRVASRSRQRLEEKHPPLAMTKRPRPAIALSVENLPSLGEITSGKN
jgi:hypothetical protein